MERAFITKIVFGCTLLALSSCAHTAAMTRQSFSDIQLGTSADDIVKTYGSPYQVTTRKDGTQEYEYLERFMMGEETVEQNKYFLVIKNGQVVSKRYNQELPPAYDEIYDEDPNDVPN